MIRILITGLILATIFIFGMDREIARRDYVANGRAEGCLWNWNCEHYNG